MKPSLTAAIITHNEELNLPLCLDSLRGLCDKIVVVDSGSTDQTEAVARRFGAVFLSHPWETAPQQWNWILANLPGQSEWILALDADHRLTPELREEIREALRSGPPEVRGYYLPRKQIFRGQWLRHGGYWPKYLLKLFRAGSAHCDNQELLDFRFYVDGKTALLKQPLIEENLKEREILFWLEKHLRFAELHAQEEVRRRHERSTWAVRPSPLGSPDQRTLWWKGWWYRLPPLSRPFPYFVYRYFFQLGFLDGKEGRLFHFLHTYWYERMIAVRVMELESSRRAGSKPPPA